MYEIQKGGWDMINSKNTNLCTRIKLNSSIYLVIKYRPTIVGNPSSISIHVILVFILQII